MFVFVHGPVFSLPNPVLDLLDPSRDTHFQDVGERFADPGLHVVRHDRGGGVRNPADSTRDLVRGAVVEQSSEHRRVRSAWQQHRHVGVRMFALCLHHQRMECSDDLSVRAVHHPKPRVEIEVIPTLPQLTGMRRVDHEMYGDQLVGTQSLPIAQRLEHREVNRVDEDENPVARILHQLDRL